MSSTTQDTTFYIPENPILARLVEAAKAAANDDAEEAKRIHRGAALVEQGAVYFDGKHCFVKSGNALYPVNGHCPCPDMAWRRSPCKHTYAKWLSIRLAQEREKMIEQSTVRSLRFVASLGDGASQQHGTATVWQDGKIVFQPYDSDEQITCSYYEVVLGNRLD